MQLTTEQMVILLRLKNGNAVTGWALIHALGDKLPRDPNRSASWIEESLLVLREIGFVIIDNKTKSKDYRMLMYRITADGYEYLRKTIH